MVKAVIYNMSSLTGLLSVTKFDSSIKIVKYQRPQLDQGQKIQWHKNTTKKLNTAENGTDKNVGGLWTNLIS